MQDIPDGVARHPGPAGGTSGAETGGAAARTEVLASAQAVVAAFASNRVDDYFACFHPAASFVFAGTPTVLGSRAEYREEWGRWEQDGFEVLSCDSTDQRVQVFGPLAIFTHSISTRLRAAEGEEVTCERETIVFARQDDGAWLAVHEHVSPAPHR